MHVTILHTKWLQIVAFVSKFLRYKQAGDLSQFKDAMSFLVESDNLISCWNYMFYEQKGFSTEYSVEYQSRLIKWILAPLHLCDRAP